MTDVGVVWGGDGQTPPRWAQWALLVAWVVMAGYALAGWLLEG